MLCLVIACQSPPVVYRVDNQNRGEENQKLLARQLWTATNLRIFDSSSIFWKNYNSGKILPVGTSVRLTKIEPTLVIFLDTENNWEEYTVYWCDTPKVAFEAESYKYFTAENPNPQVERLSEEIQKAIQLGNVQKGMSKDIVLLSRGYPTEPEDPKNASIWVYADNEKKQTVVYFENDIVVKVVRG